MRRYENKIILVTGGQTGIGEAITKRLRQEGGLVITAQRRAYDDSFAWQIELDRPEECRALIEKIKSDYGRLDLLVNNAGIMGEAALDDQDDSLWHKTIAINLTAPYLLISYAYQMLKACQGNIINIGSIEGLAANPHHSAYVASKAGLHGLTKSIAVDAGADGIRCNAIAPGWIDTKLNEAFMNAQDNPEAFAQSISAIHPIGRTGHPDDIAALAAFLGSDEASFITGEIYRIDGGRMAKLPLP